MTRHALLALDKGHPGQFELIEQHFNVIRPRAPDPERAIKDNAAQIKAITTYLNPVSRSLIEMLPNLEIISCGAVGVDHIDLDAAAERGIAVTHTPDVLTADTADTSFMLMINIMRRGVEGDAFVRAGLWKTGSLPLGTCLAGKTVGIVGLGRIGQAFAKRAEAFDMDIAYYGPNEKDEFPYAYYDDLQALAADSDVLVLTCCGGVRTRHLINHTILKALGPKGFLINIARGSVVNQRDLLVALSNKDIAGAGLDVYDDEPNVPDDLFSRDDVVLLPHIGSATLETRTKMGQIVAGNLLAHFNGEPLLTPV
jgi:hydroxypyruvate reductase 2